MSRSTDTIPRGHHAPQTPAAGVVCHLTFPRSPCRIRHEVTPTEGEI